MNNQSIFVVQSLWRVVKLSIFASAFVLIAPFVNAAGGDANEHIVHADIEPQNKASLQRGAQIYVNNCLGCHSLKFMRYERLAQDLGIPENILKDHLMFTSEKLGDQLTIAMEPKEASAWFGAPPPDLTLEARLRGNDWLYSYLIGFYPDESRPLGVNNHVFKDVGMPDALEPVRNSMNQEQFKDAMLDLTNFLAYTADPIKMERERLGRYVLIFLALLFIPVYFLNREYWKDVH